MHTFSSNKAATASSSHSKHAPSNVYILHPLVCSYSKKKLERAVFDY